MYIYIVLYLIWTNRCDRPANRYVIRQYRKPTNIHKSKLSKLSKLFWGSQDARVPIAVLAAPRSCPARVHTRLPTDGPRVVAPKEATVGGKLGSSKLGTSTAGSDFLPGISRYVYTHTHTHTYIYICVCVYVRVF